MDKYDVIGLAIAIRFLKLRLSRLQRVEMPHDGVDEIDDITLDLVKRRQAPDNVERRPDVIDRARSFIRDQVGRRIEKARDFSGKFRNLSQPRDATYVKIFDLRFDLIHQVDEQIDHIDNSGDQLG